MRRSLSLLLLAFGLLGGSFLFAQKKEVIPHAQDAPPGPPLSPSDAIKKMKVPPGFTVELVASEPDLVNPVAMTFDEKGRIWVTESLEYPRHSAGPGKDRIKILEDTKGTGKIDKVTIFADGLNIPSGIAVGHGGVWVANAPDILFYRIGPDGKAAGKPAVVVTGFGRTDTHELPNSLTWGPDGWLYGFNGVFNQSHVRQNGKQFDFTCALFRIHPKTREFQLFCEGTSNPWGIAFDPEGSAFVSACVIDHLWHLTETGYYHRQGGPYPPFTWKLGSIVKHRHQKAAYCGLHYFDSDAYPPEYRDRLYMGNIHGGCINVDVLRRDGSTYTATPAPDFLTANDAWFMPVSQKTGPDGCLYILDWYDRYHCYQDANRDPAGIDRVNGRLYRIRYKDTPRAPKFDLSKESDAELIARLGSANILFRDLAQRLLCERNTPAVREALKGVILDDKQPRKKRMHALWALVGTGEIDSEFAQKLLTHADPGYRAWGVRAVGNGIKVNWPLAVRLLALAKDPSRDVQLQVAIAARKVRAPEPVSLLFDVLGACGDDKVIPSIVWQNLTPLLDEHEKKFGEEVLRRATDETPNLKLILPRAIEYYLAKRKTRFALTLASLAVLNSETAGGREVLAMLASKIQTGELTGEDLVTVKNKLRNLLVAYMEKPPELPERRDAVLFLATLKEPAGLIEAQRLLTSPAESEAIRLRALEALVTAGEIAILDRVGELLGDTKRFSGSFRDNVLSALGRLDHPRVATEVLAVYDRLPADQQPKAIELLTQRTAWAKALVKAIAEKTIPADVVGANQLRRMLALKDAELLKEVKTRWGTVREERNPAREKVVDEMRRFLAKAKGDAEQGRTVFKNLCGQCHKIHGEGIEVGPDLTSNGRSSYDQLLSNVFDPSLVIGAAYQAVTVNTVQGRVLTGLLAEDSKERVVLKAQGGKLEIVARKDVESVTVSRVSLMPEGVETQLKRQEIADLFAFLTLDKPPSDPKARHIPGSPSFR
jgi:putative membrane-bound dehydrogenase-like protein